MADIIAGQDRTYTGAQGTSIAKIFDMSAASTGASEKSLKAAGIPYRKSYTFSASHAGYYPGGTSMQVKLLYTPEGRVLGGQITGYDGVDPSASTRSLRRFATVLPFMICRSWSWPTPRPSPRQRIR